MYLGAGAGKRASGQRREQHFAGRAVLEGRLEGYRRGTDLLVEQVLEKRVDQDWLVYPIAFLHRQHSELRLKELIWTGSRYLEKPCEPPSSLPRGHDILKLWMRCRGLLEEMPDPPEFAFRFPTKRKKKGEPVDTPEEPSLPDITLINIRHLSEVVTAVAMFLDGVSIQLDRELD